MISALIWQIDSRMILLWSHLFYLNDMLVIFRLTESHVARWKVSLYSDATVEFSILIQKCISFNHQDEDLQLDYVIFWQIEDFFECVLYILKNWWIFMILKQNWLSMSRDQSEDKFKKSHSFILTQILDLWIIDVVCEKHEFEIRSVWQRHVWIVRNDNFANVRIWM